MLQQYLNDLVTNVGGWSLNNFGEQSAHRPLLGIIEELTELEEALDRWNRNEVLDAVGDIVIYMSDYYFCRARQSATPGTWTLGVAWGDAGMNDLANWPVSKFIQSLAHSHLKGEQNIRGGSAVHDTKLQDTCSGILARLDQICDLLDADFQDVVEGTWRKVSKRNWKLKPDTAHEVAVSDDLHITDSVQVRQLDSEIGDVLG
jgi:hypothetical protein